MTDFLAEYYYYIKSLHIIFVVTWFAGLFYIPRLYRLAIFLSYYRGYCDRKDKNKKNYHWYE